MEVTDMIPASEFCVHHHIELSFINSLQEYGMIETVLLEEKIFLPLTQLERIEKIITLYYELDINLEGIETITHLLHRMKGMQEELLRINNRLQMYEDY